MSLKEIHPLEKAEAEIVKRTLRKNMGNRIKATGVRHQQGDALEKDKAIWAGLSSINYETNMFHKFQI